VGELVQDTMVRIVESLARFRGDSAFTTWAAGIGTRVLFTELRRRRTRERRRDPFDEALADSRELGAPAPDAAASRNELLAALERAIATSLSERQRAAILAELRGVPTVEIAERLGTNPNALYKLTHDARRKLRRALADEGFGAESLRAASEDGR
jgi:RNA polymerase sigma-70 factor (ECF subfamily)